MRRNDYRLEKAVYNAIAKYFFRTAVLELLFKIIIVVGLLKGFNYLILNPLNVPSRVAPQQNIAPKIFK